MVWFFGSSLDSPVQVYQEYAKCHPADCKKQDSRIYLHPFNKLTTDIWFRRLLTCIINYCENSKKHVFGCRLRSQEN